MEKRKMEGRWDEGDKQNITVTNDGLLRSCLVIQNQEHTLLSNFTATGMANISLLGMESPVSHEDHEPFLPQVMMSLLLK